MSISFQQIILIQSSPEKIWQALTDPAVVAQYYLAPLKKLDGKPGGEIIYGTPEEAMISGTILCYEPDVQLAHTFQFGASTAATEDDPATIVLYEITSSEGGVELKLTHSGFPEENQSYANVSDGWPFILEGLKTLLERDHGLVR